MKSIFAEMLDKRKKKNGVSAGKWFSISLMISCLVFLTVINYVIYPPDCRSSTVNAFGMNTEDQENDFPPSGPTEEKSSTSSSVSIIEEMLHETHPEINFKASNHLYLHHIAEADNIEMFHPELILPPPKL